MGWTFTRPLQTIGLTRPYVPLNKEILTMCPNKIVMSFVTITTQNKIKNFKTYLI